MKRRKTITDKVIAANQENSRASTGPTTERGKHASSRNAGKHLLTAKVDVPDADSENPVYQHMLERWLNDFQPQTVWEEDLVREIVGNGMLIMRVDNLLRREVANFGAEIEGT